MTVAAGKCRRRIGTRPNLPASGRVKPPESMGRRKALPRLWRNQNGLCGGFTLLELMVVIGIIGLLASIGIPNYYQSIEDAKITKAVGDISVLEKELLAYYVDKEAYPETLEDINRSSLTDPWGNPYQYLNIATAKGKGKMRKDHFLVPINTDFDLYSMGPDGDSQSPLTAKASHDDIIRANNGEYIGEASSY